MIAGHLDLTDLDPVTAKAVELLAAADVMAAERAGIAPRRAPRMWREPIWQLTVGVMGVLVVVAVALFFLVHKNTDAQTQTDRIVELQRQINDCVSPGGECAKRGAAQTANAVALLNAVTVAVVECADSYDGKAAIEECVQRQLAKLPLSSSGR